MFLLIAVLLAIIPLVRWLARIEARNAEADDNRAMQKCKEADERSLQQSVERVAQKWVHVRKAEEETQEAPIVQDEDETEEVDCKAVMLAYKHLMEVGALGD